MNIQKSVVFIFTVLSVLNHIYAATPCAQGDKAYELLQYSKAITAYEKCLKKYPDDVYILEKLGDSYMILDKSEKAEGIYAQLVKKTKKYSPAILKYVNAIYVNNKMDRYQIVVDSLLIKYPKQKEVQKLKTYRLPVENIIYEVSPAKFNAEEADFSPVYYGEKIIFSSSRQVKKKSDLFTGQSYTGLYITDTIDNVVLPFLPEISMKYNVGSCTFYDQGQKMIFSANDKSKLIRNTYLLQLYLTEQVDGKWTKPQPFVHNQRNANNTHPAINPSANILVFASDGYGTTGMDLYFCTKDVSGKWKPASKLKNTINSQGNEVFPVFINDSLLIYSSDGLQTVGKGLDMYKTVFKKGKWSDPILLDAPFNSVADDYGLTSIDNLKTGWFTSNRNNVDGNEDIYSFRQNVSDSIIYVADTPIQEVTSITVTGKLTMENGKPVGDAQIVFYNTDGDIMEEVVSSADGSFETTIQSGQWIQYKVEKKGYYPETGTFLTQDGTIDKDAGLELKMRSLKKDAIFTLENIYYDYDKWDILPESEVELNNLYNVLVQYPNMKIELSSHTDVRGKDAYNMVLSDKRAKSAVAYLIQLGIQKNRITAKGYGETKLTNHCLNGVTCTDDEHRKNRRTEVRIISLD